MARQRIDPITVRKSGGQSLRTVASFAPITNVPKLNLGSEKTQKFQKAILGLKSELQTYEKIEDVKQDNRDKRAAEGQFFIDQKALATANKDHAGELDTTLPSEADIHRAAAERMNAQSYMWQTTYATLQGENAASTEIAKLNEQMAAAVASGDLKALEEMRDVYKNVRGSMFEKGKGNAFFTGGLTSKFREADQNFARSIAENVRNVRTKKMSDEVNINVSDIYGRLRKQNLTKDEDASQKVSEVTAKTQALVATGLVDGATARTKLVDLTIQAADNNGDHVQGGAYIDALLRGSADGTLMRADGQPLRLTDAEQEKLKDAKEKLVDEFYKDQDRQIKLTNNATALFKNNIENIIYEKLSKGEKINVGALKSLVEEELKKPENIGTGARYNLGDLRKFITSVDADIDKAQFNRRFPTPESQSLLMSNVFVAISNSVENNKQQDNPASDAAVHQSIIKRFKLPVTLANQAWAEVKRLGSTDENWMTKVRGVRSTQSLNNTFGKKGPLGLPSNTSKHFRNYYEQYIREFIGNDFKLDGDKAPLNYTSTDAALKLDKSAVTFALNKLWQGGRLDKIGDGPPIVGTKDYAKKLEAYTATNPLSGELSAMEIWEFAVVNHRVSPDTTPSGLSAIIHAHDERSKAAQSASPPSTPTTNAAAKEALNKSIGGTGFVAPLGPAGAPTPVTPTPVTPTTGAPPPPPPVTPASNNDLDVSGSLSDLANQAAAISENREKAIEQAVGRTEIEENRNDLPVAEMLSSVVGSGGEIVSRLKPEFIEKAAGFVNDLKSANVISNDVPLDVIEDIISKFYGAEGVFGNPDWAEEAARQIQNVSIDDGVD